MKVAIAVIKNELGQVLVTRRALDTHLGGFWEFPGGKIETDESPEAAMVREIYEEVGLKVLTFSLLTTIEHGALTLYVFEVSTFEGTATPCAGQLDLRWVSGEELKRFSFPPANEGIIARIC